jgi:hypothetical protein
MLSPPNTVRTKVRLLCGRYCAQGWYGGCAPKETSYPAREGETFVRRV